MQYQEVFAFLFALLVVYVVVRILYLPLRFLAFLLYNGVIGGLVLWIVNLLGAFVNFHIGLNPATAVIAGLLGIPGVAALVLLRTLLG